MKFTLIFIIILSIISFNLFAKNENDCKKEAESIAYDVYTSENSSSEIYLKTFKPKVEDKKIIHFIQIYDQELRSTNTMTIILQKSNCSLIRID